MVAERLVLVIHPEAGKQVNAALAEEIAERNRRLANYKRVGGYLVWERDFPLTASLKCKRGELAGQIREAVSRESIVPL